MGQHNTDITFFSFFSGNSQFNCDQNWFLFTANKAWRFSAETRATLVETRLKQSQVNWKFTSNDWFICQGSLLVLILFIMFKSVCIFLTFFPYLFLILGDYIRNQGANLRTVLHCYSLAMPVIQHQQDSVIKRSSLARHATASCLSKKEKDVSIYIIV